MQFKKIILVLLLGYQTSFATTYVIPPDGNVVGELQYTQAQVGESLSEIGIRYDVGYYEMVRANPHVNPREPLSPQTQVIIPSQYILPPGSHQGIVINLAEYRLYYFPENDNVVMTYPVGIGRKGWNTPIGVTRVVAKQHDPVWRPTAKLRAEAEKKGVLIPENFPAGPDNPLGRHTLRLSWPTYLIHGTNRTEGIGMRVSAGCIRMLADDIDYLFAKIAVGTKVTVINQAIKLGQMNGALFIEVHQKVPDLNTLANKGMTAVELKRLNQAPLNQEFRFPTGIPKKILA